MYFLVHKCSFLLHFYMLNYLYLNVKKWKCLMNNDELQQLKRNTLDEMHFHFVFNILNTLRYMVNTDTDIAYEMIYDLSLFLRCTM